MRLEQYISQLLYRYQCVTVPGFGAFLTEFVSAQLHEPSHTFSPPKKVVSFNVHLKNNDGLLANHISQSEQITYESAVGSIAQIVSDWKSILQNQEILYLNNIGHVRLNTEGGLVFKPFDHTNYHLGSFGLSEIVCQEVERFVLDENSHEAVVSTQSVAFSNDIQQTESSDKQQPKPILWVRYAAAAVVVGFLGTASYFWMEQKIEDETLIVEQKVQQKVNQKIQEATFFIESPISAVSLNVAEDKKPYQIVCAAFREYTNAEKAMKNLVNQGYQSSIGEKNAYGLYPVFYGSYSQRTDALEAMQNIKRSHNPEAWLLVQD
jgi:hypothetical protein